MQPGNERKVITECVEGLMQIREYLVSLSYEADELKERAFSIEVRLSELAAPVPEGYMHAPGCVQRGTGWHTCDPIPVEQPPARPKWCPRCEQHANIFGGPCAEHRTRS